MVIEIAQVMAVALLVSLACAMGASFDETRKRRL
jgi:hypothetical protein